MHEPRRVNSYAASAEQTVIIVHFISEAAHRASDHVLGKLAFFKIFRHFVRKQQKRKKREMIRCGTLSVGQSHGAKLMSFLQDAAEYINKQ